MRNQKREAATMRMKIGQAKVENQKQKSKKAKDTHTRARCKRREHKPELVIKNVRHRKVVLFYS